MYLVIFTILASAATGAAGDCNAPRAGGPVGNVSASEQAFFADGAARFAAIDSVQGTEPGASDGGLGPRFNSNGCGSCHAYPAMGGSSPAVNPQVAVATRYGARNAIPSFVQAHGPVREARFKANADGTPDGGVHDLFVITGRHDAPQQCAITQPDFADAQQQNNVSFRIPTPVFGAGLIAAISDATIVANQHANWWQKLSNGIAGVPNHSGNDGTITRFGWKAQNKSPEIFAGEAYNVEQGVTNDLFGQERETDPACATNALPEDTTNFDANTVQQAASDVAAFAQFMRFLAPPARGPATDQANAGATVFHNVGCDLCHTPSLMTGNDASPALANQQVNLYSDLLLHHMGSGLADGISQGGAAGDQFRTAPLWGVGQRLFFLHDGRTNDLNTAILAHASAAATGSVVPSEANRVIARYQLLTPEQQAQLVAFLQSL